MILFRAAFSFSRELRRRHLLPGDDGGAIWAVLYGGVKMLPIARWRPGFDFPAADDIWRLPSAAVTLSPCLAMR